MRVIRSAFAAFAVTLLLAGTAQADNVTIGSPGSAEFDTFKALDSLTLLNTSLGEPGANLVSPVNGAIVNFRIIGIAGFSYSLRVLRPRGGGVYTAVAASEPLTIGGDKGTRLYRPIPINAGDTIGLDIPAGSVFAMATQAAGSVVAGWSPQLPEAATQPAVGNKPGYEIGLSAEIQPAPTIASISPRSGFVRGGTEVTIKGTDFAGVKAVEFGTVRARRISVKPNGEIVATAPAATATGPAHITVTTVAGHTRAVAADRFEYTACQTPRLRQKTLAAARRTLNRAGCRLGKVTLRNGASRARGRVTSQGPKAQLQLPPGTRVNVTLG
jgi:IPT/TIG domain/PASTA domain